MLADQTLLLAGARFVPAIVDGKAQRLKIFGIRPGSFYRLAGLENGDQIERVAGLPMASLENALAAYRKIRESAIFTVSVRKRKVPTHAMQQTDRRRWVLGKLHKNTRRWLEIRSPMLQALLAKQARGRQPDDLLFGASRSLPFATPALWKWLRSFCKSAGVPRVCPHSLRGLHSTLAMEHGATSGLVAAALGHGSFEVTQRHYVQPGTMDNLKQAKVSAALESLEPSAPADLTALSGLLQKLSPEGASADPAHRRHISLEAPTFRSFRTLSECDIERAISRR